MSATSHVSPRSTFYAAASAVSASNWESHVFDDLNALYALSKRPQSPTNADSQAAKRVLRYIKKTKHLGLTYSKESLVTGFSDSDWAGDSEDRKSTSGRRDSGKAGARASQTREQDRRYRSKSRRRIEAAVREARVVRRREARIAEASRRGIRSRRLRQEICLRQEREM